MTIELKKQWRHWTPGTVIESLGQAICDELIRRGVAVQVAGKQVVSAPREKIMRSPKRAK